MAKANPGRAERDRRIHELRELGWTRSAIAEEVGCSVSTVSNVANPELYIRQDARHQARMTRVRRDRLGEPCIAPEAHILTRDLQWVSAGDLAAGDELLAFDDYGPPRHWSRSVVLRVERMRRPCYDLTFSDGTQIRCSLGHQWLKYGTDHRTGWRHTYKFRATDHISSRIVKPLDVWQADRSYEGGYLAAAFDGEGSLSRRNNYLSFTQKENAMLERVECLLKQRGCSYSRYPTTDRGIVHLGINTQSNVLTMLGEIQPARLLDVFAVNLSMYRSRRMFLSRVVTPVERTEVGAQDVVAIATTTGTYLAEGLAAHGL